MGGKATSRAARAGGLVTLLAWLAAVLAGGVAPAAAPLDPGLLAFLSAGGSLDDVCGHGSQGHAAGDRHCDACRLLDPPVLPEPVRCAPVPRRPYVAAVAPAAPAATAVSRRHPGAPRAPPLAS